MKILFTIVILISAAASYAQRVPSSCDAPDSVKEMYRADAACLAYDYQTDVYPSWLDSTTVPKELRDTFLSKLIAVYNATQLQDAYYVTHAGFYSDFGGVYTKGIHNWRHPLFDTIIVNTFGADTNIMWEKKIFLGLIPTGNKALDSIIDAFGMTVVSVEFGSVSLHTNDYYNLSVVTKQFNGITTGTNVYAYSNSMMGDGNFIRQKHDTITHLIYSLGWGDCPSGCISRDYWYFSVYPDCTVSFDGSLDVNIDTKLKNKLNLYPNPAFGTLIIETEPHSMIEIIDLQGKILQKIVSKEDKTEMDVSSLFKGVYFIRAINKSGKLEMGKFIKE